MSDKDRLVDHEGRIHALETRLKRTQDALGSLITWTAQSAASPISVTDAKALLDKLVDR